MRDRYHDGCLLQLNLMKRANKLNRALNMNKRVLLFLANNDIAGVRRLLSQALREGKSANRMLDSLEFALQGKYHAKGYSDRDFDIAILALTAWRASFAICFASVCRLSKYHDCLREDEAGHGETTAYGVLSSSRFILYRCAVLADTTSVLAVSVLAVSVLAERTPSLL